MSFISFNYNKNLIYAIIYWTLEIIHRTFVYLSWNKYYNIVINDAINEYIYVILLNISDLLAGFLVIYINCVMKKKGTIENLENTINNPSASNLNIISGKGIKVPKSQFFIFKLILICLLSFLNRSSFFIFYQTNKDVTHNDIDFKLPKDILVHMDIIFRYIFSILMFKTKVYIHHTFSIILICIGFVILIPTDIWSIGFDNLTTYKHIAITSYRGISFPFQDTLVKKVFIDDYVIPEFLMFIKGVGLFIIILIITPFLYFFVWIDEGDIFSTEQSIGGIILIILIYIFQSFIRTYILFKVIYNLSSQSVSFLIISESLTGSIAEIIKFCISEDHEYNIATLIIDIIVILITTFATLIYDEILVLKICGLNKNIAREIRLRAKTDLYSIGILEDETVEEEVEEEESKMNSLSEDITE